MASRFEEATEKASSLSYDVAILDVNLDGRPSFPIAETIAERRRPFVLTTGYGLATVPQSLKAAPRLQKPFLRQDLEKALRAVLAPAGQSGQAS